MNPSTLKAVRTAALSAVDALNRAEQAGAPVQVGAARELALIEGLMAIAEAAGASLERPVGIDARGEISVIGIRDNIGASKAYGADFAALISAVPRRTGTVSTETPSLPESGWCRIHHFDVEKLIRLIAEGRHPAMAPKAPAADNDGPSF